MLRELRLPRAENSLVELQAILQRMSSGVLYVRYTKTELVALVVQK